MLWVTLYWILIDNLSTVNSSAVDSNIKISVIIPVYNVAPYIEKCLESVLMQCSDDMEIILVDDCGTDRSMEIVQAFCRSNNGKCRILGHEKNRGLSAARNTGVLHAKGDYVYFLDSDDELPPNSIANFLSYLKEYGDADFLIGNYLIEGNYKFKPLQTPVLLEGNEKIWDAFVAGKWYVMACGKLVNRNFFIKNNLWFAEGRLHEDELFSFLLAMSASRMITVAEKVYKYVICENSISTSKKEKNYIDMFWILLRKLDLIEQNKSRFSNMPDYVISILFQYAVFVSDSCLPFAKRKVLLGWVRRQAMQHTFEKISWKTAIQRRILLCPLSLTSVICKLANLRNK